MTVDFRYEGESISNQPSVMHLDQRCSSVISPELKKSVSFPLTHSSTAVTTSSSAGNEVHRYPFSSLGIGRSH